MKKAITILVLILLAGCTQSETIPTTETTKDSEVVSKQLDPSEMTQEELNALTNEEIDKINGPKDGKPIEINKTVTVGDYEVTLNHYYKVDGIYRKFATGHVQASTPTNSEDGYAILNAKLTNSSDEEISSMVMVSFDVITPNGEVKSGNIHGTNMYNQLEDGSDVIPGGYKEGNQVMIAPKEDVNLTLRITEVAGQNLRDPMVVEVPLPVE
ncbi:DUF4352 domain-containing protein [Metabacillus sp. B2-18]|uniref:DUF4352 domain-containing protein n=1 Tax=Metabacillus sp. B2-18 TaxID=2897333 RepID=UPI001E336629|nr:DUF4352 domain-containing protein [Metabacillus sp. B2-18]UGB30554.1 DUF4352 domain-containing protein [Metabacillus sp. B2-18]